MSEDKNSAAYKIGKPFRDDEPENGESLWSKVKTWLKSQVEAPTFGQTVTKELKKKQNNQLTTPKK